jgi:hypothetical protein
MRKVSSFDYPFSLASRLLLRNAVDTPASEQNFTRRQPDDFALYPDR